MKKVLIGISGGVDSSVAAYLLKKEGYEVIGATMLLTDNVKIEDAKRVCDELNIEHHVIDLRKEFKEQVINNFIDNYKNGKTPNPCIECNKYFKFGLFYEFAKKLGCDFIATGHYAKVENGKLYKIDSIKDQTYFLYKIDKEVLKQVLFPLSNYSDKKDIREIAKNANLSVFNKGDSQDICFIENNDYKAFIDKNIDSLPTGDFILDGKAIGKHSGITNYTIGQRKGLNISYKKPLYVIKIDAVNNNIILGDIDDLMSTTLVATNVNLLDDLPDFVDAKVRYRSNLVKAKLSKLGTDILVEFEEPVKSITAGQSVVFYVNNECIGGGIIK